MRSLLLEFLRLNNLATGIWREGDPYLVAAGSEHPIRQFSSPLEHEKFLDLTRAPLPGRCPETHGSPEEIGKIAPDLLETRSLTAPSSGSFPLQLDLVVNPAEVAALPLEAATDGEGTPLFARANPAVVLTRRVRAAFAETSVRWPAKPRLLYAWAAPPGAGDVPAAAHEAALRETLGPWMPVQQGASTASGTAVLATLAKATLERLAEASLSKVGLIEKDDDYYVPEIYACYESDRGPGSPAWIKAFHNVQGTHACPPIRFIGEWDTVGALGASGLLGAVVQQEQVSVPRHWTARADPKCISCARD